LDSRAIASWSARRRAQAKRALDGLERGKVLEFIATDPGTKADIPALIKRLGSELLEMKEENGKYIFYIKR
jgi:tRNA 2-thiouridine synthesizing protein A